MRKAVVPSLLVLLVLSSCASGGSAPGKAADGKTQVDWVASFLPKEPERALALACAMPETTKQAAGEAWRGLVSQAVGALDAAFAAALAAGDWPRALQLRESLEALDSAAASFPEAASGIDRALLSSWPEGRILRSWSAAASLAGNLPLTVGLALRALTAIGGPAASPDYQAALQEALEAARKAGDGAALRDLIALMDGAKLPVPEADRASARASRSIPQMLGGVCTIWVNRGLKVQQGMAVADRVIGSGFFIDGRGYLLTNYHVIESEVDPTYEGYSRLYVRLPGKTEDRIPAKVVGWDRSIDIALLKTEAKPSYVFSLSSSRSFLPGDKLYAIGSPAGLESTVSAGIVSAVDRDVLPLAKALQVDVPVNPGNSGGPVLDESGELAGVVFAGLADYQGLNFAIDARTIAARLPSLYAGGAAKRGFMGAVVQDLDGRPQVVYVLPGSAAADAGVREGDVLESIDGAPVPDADAARKACAGIDAGRLAALRLLRRGSEVALLADFRERPYLPLEKALGSDAKARLLAPVFGMEAERVRRGLLGDSYSVSRVYPGGAADEIGLSEGDPFALKDWQVDKDKQAVFIQIYVERRKRGFMESIIQMGASYALIPFI